MSKNAVFQSQRHVIPVNPCAPSISRLINVPNFSSLNDSVGTHDTSIAQGDLVTLCTAAPSVTHPPPKGGSINCLSIPSSVTPVTCALFPVAARRRVCLRLPTILCNASAL
jgi:hypothetical protein